MIGVLVSGEGTNLQALLDECLPVAAVASNVAEARALARATTAGIANAVFPLAAYADRAERDAAMADWLAGQGVELVVCAGFMQLLTPAFLDRFPRGPPCPPPPPRSPPGPPGPPGRPGRRSTSSTRASTRVR